MLRCEVPDPYRVAGVVAGTLIEMWWLAGAHTDPNDDVVRWIWEIVRRRIADSRPTDPPEPVLLGALWAKGVEAELAALLNTRAP